LEKNIVHGTCEFIIKKMWSNDVTIYNIAPDIDRLLMLISGILRNQHEFSGAQMTVSSYVN